MSRENPVGILVGTDEWVQIPMCSSLFKKTRFMCLGFAVASSTFLHSPSAQSGGSDGPCSHDSLDFGDVRASTFAWVYRPSAVLLIYNATKNATGRVEQSVLRAQQANAFMKEVY